MANKLFLITFTLIKSCILLFKKNKFIQVALLAIVAMILAAIICSYKGNNWEESIRTVLYKAKGDSVPSFATEQVDVNGIPKVYYAPQNDIVAGTQYNATIVANYAINYYDEYKKNNNHLQLAYFNNCIKWLTKEATQINNSLLYYYNWQQPWYVEVKGNFTSGITSGRAIEAFVLAFKQTNDSSYLQLCKELVRGYYLPIQLGGFTYKETNGWWYEEIADSNLQTPKILDGHIYAILGVQKYAQLTKDDSATTVVNKGIEVLKNNLQQYDAGNGKIYYDKYKKIADKKYQQILVDQMHELWKITNDVFFKNYYQKWNDPLTKNYVLKIVQEKNISGLLLYFILTTIVFFVGLIFFRVLNKQ